MGWFRHWFGTRYYALLYGHRNEADARTWVHAILEQWDLAPNSRLLDMACGRGRHARWFVEAGLNVTGIDISEDSIAEARKVVPGARFDVHDMREPYGTEDFDAACCLFTSLGYFETRTDDRLVFSAVVQSLRPGGRFVLDFMNTDLVLRDLVPHERIERDGVLFTISRTLENGILVKRIRVDDAGAVHYFEERVQALRAAEIEGMAVTAGLRIMDRTEGPDLLPFDPERSHRFVLWTTKPVA